MCEQAQLESHKTDDPQQAASTTPFVFALPALSLLLVRKAPVLVRFPHQSLYQHMRHIFHY